MPQPRRLPETLADYLVVAICPVLIGMLVGSLMYFLVLTFYEGDQTARLLWTMTMFVVATVGIARISMEQGQAYAMLFAAPLAGALALVLPPLAWPLLALVWWATHKLTWDCTLIEDSRDTTGRGLLQHMGLEPSVGQRVPSLADSSSDAVTTQTPVVDGLTKPSHPPGAWWQSLWHTDKRPHAPGIWVVYFSLAALPLFGLGSWFITDSTVKQQVFWLLVLYVGCGMALLAATSFLGLRRYLRQRQIEMPLEITATWLTTGALLIVAMLLLAAVLPRPTKEYSLTQVPVAVAWTVRKASRFAVLREGIKDESPNRATAQSESKEAEAGATKSGGKAKQPGQSSDDSSKSSPGGKEGEKGKKGGQSSAGKGESSKSSDSGDRQSSQKSGSSSDAKKSASSSQKNEANKPSDSQRQDNKASNGSSSDQKPEAPQSSPTQTLSQTTSNILQSIGRLVRPLFYAALVIGGIIVLFIYREQLVAALRKLLDELRELWAAWFGAAKPDASPAAAATSTAVPSRPFSAFHDPFASGAAATMSWAELVNYSFAAAEAWARERRVRRDPDQTPLEFAAQLGHAAPHLAAPAQALATAYSQLAYARQTATAGPVESLRKLWQVLNLQPASAEAIAERH